MFRKRLWSSVLKGTLPIILVALAVVVFIGLVTSRPKIPAKPTSERAWNVRAVSVHAGTQHAQIELYGNVEAPQMASLSAAIAADVIDLPAQEGTRVKAGDLLVQLDDRDVRLQLRQQQAQLDSTAAQIAAEQIRYNSDRHDLSLQQDLVKLKQADLKRYQDLSKRKLVSQQQIDSARAALQQQQLNLNNLQQSIADHPNRLAQLQASKSREEALLDARKLDLERTRIRAPFSARIAKVHVAQGDRVRVGDALVDLYDLNRLEVRAQLPERLLAQLRPALADKQTEVLATTQVDGQALTLRLDRLGATVSSGRAGVDGLFHFVNPSLIPEPGRTLSLQLTLPPQPNLIPLPPAALYGSGRVYKVVDSRLHAVPVTRVGDRTGPDGTPQILVRSAQLNSGDKVLSTQLPNAISGLLVKVTDADGGTE